MESLEQLRVFVFSEKSLGKINEETANEIIKIIDEIYSEQSKQILFLRQQNNDLSNYCDLLKEKIASFEKNLSSPKREENISMPKKLLEELILSNARLGDAEYKRNTSYNNSHFHYKAEKNVIGYLQSNYPEFMKNIYNNMVKEIEKETE